MKTLHDLTERELLQASMGLFGNYKYFNSSTSIDIANKFHWILICSEDVTFSYLQEEGIELCDTGGVLNGNTFISTMYSKDGFTDLKVSAGYIKAISINELV